MLDLKYLPVQFTFFLILGIIIGYYLKIDILHFFILLISSFLYLSYLYSKSLGSYRPSFKFFILTGFIFIVFGILITNSQNPINNKKHYIHQITAKNKITFQISKVLKSNSYYHKYEADILQMNQKVTHGKVLIMVKKDSLKAKMDIDDILFTNNELKIVHKARNPDEFDYHDFLKKQLIFYQITLDQNDFIIINEKYRTLKGVAYFIRENINTEFKNVNFHQTELAIVNALLLGQRQDITKEQFNNYKNAGAIHILAVSGLHIGIILLFLNFIFKPIETLKKGKILKLILVVICLWVYAFIVGFSPSMIRSVTMFSAIAIALVSKREFAIQQSLVLSAFILLLINPIYLFHVGFQLSYTAVFCIVWLQPVFAKLWKPNIKILKYFWNLLTVTFAAQIGILPLSLYYFHQFPSLFFISSLVIIPFLGIILGIGFLLIILGLLNSIPQKLAKFYELIIRTLNEFVAFISNQEGFVFENISFSLINILIFYLLLISTITLVKNKNTHNLYFVIVIVLILQISFIQKKYVLQNTNEFIIFHQSKKSILANRLGDKMIVYQKKGALKREIYSPLNAYQINNSGLSLHDEGKVQNVMKINSKKILIIDSLGVYQNLNYKPNMVILINSPKINLERFLQNIDPNMVIADGSNFVGFTKLWEKTCKNKSVRFYTTRENGAFVYQY